MNKETPTLYCGVCGYVFNYATYPAASPLYIVRDIGALYTPSPIQEHVLRASPISIYTTTTMSM